MNKVIKTYHNNGHITHTFQKREPWDNAKNDDFVQLEVRNLDGSSEGDGLVITITDDKVKKGDYTPMSLPIKEARRLVEFLARTIKVCEADRDARCGKPCRK